MACAKVKIIKIRKPSGQNYKEVIIADVDSNFLQCLFQLDFSPMYLRSDDKWKELVPITQKNKLTEHKSFVIEHHSFSGQQNEIRLATSLTIAANFITEEKECQEFCKKINMNLIEFEIADIKYVIAEYKKLVFVAFNKKYELESKMEETFFGMNLNSQCNDLFQTIIKRLVFINYSFSTQFFQNMSVHISGLHTFQRVFN